MMLRMAMVAILLTTAGTGCVANGACVYADGKPGACWDSRTMYASTWQEMTRRKAELAKNSEAQRQLEAKQRQEAADAAAAEARLEEERQRIRSACFVIKNTPDATPVQRGACDEFFADEAARERYAFWRAEFEQRQRAISAQQAQADAQQNQARVQAEATAEAQRQARVALFLQALGAAAQRQAEPATLVPQTVRTDCHRYGNSVSCTSR